MWWIIIAFVFVLITVCILRDTRVKVYEVGFCAELQEEFDLKLPLWTWLLLIFTYFIPAINIVTFMVFLVSYIINSFPNPKEWEGKVHVLSLNGNNWITKSLLAMKKILNKKI